MLYRQTSSFVWRTLRRFPYAERFASPRVASSLAASTHRSLSTTTAAAAAMAMFCGGPNATVICRQLFDEKSNTYTYLLADRGTKEAAIIDPVIDKVDRDIGLIRELGLSLRYALNTHLHADHVTGSGMLKKQIAGVRSVISAASGARADVHVKDGDEVKIGDSLRLRVLATPGHTNGCVSYVEDGLSCVFTGDAVLIRGCGRTDFQEGSPERLYESVHSKIFTLPEHYFIYPAHDYKGMTCSTVAEEKQFNPRLSKSQKEFVEIMNNLKLAYPKQMDFALPLNQVCGIQEP